MRRHRVAQVADALAKVPFFKEFKNYEKCYNLLGTMMKMCCKQTCGQFKNLYLDTDIGQLDCLSFIDGVGDCREVRRASELVEVENVQLRVLSLDVLIKAKKAMKRPRDKQTILELEAIKKLKSSICDRR